VKTEDMKLRKYTSIFEGDQDINNSF